MIVLFKYVFYLTLNLKRREGVFCYRWNLTVNVLLDIFSYLSTVAKKAHFV